MISKLRIAVGFKAGKSYLKDAFFTRPFHLANVGQYKTDNDLYLMVMSSSPGLLDRDHYDISIGLERNSRLQLHSQAYQRLYNMQEGATQAITIDLERGSAFSYAPHPVVPHRNSKFKSHTLVYLQDDCELLLTEIITCGRKHSGEVFRFSYFQNLTEIYYKRKLVLKDNIFLQPNVVPLCTIGQSESYTHQGTLIYMSSGKKSINAYADEIRQSMGTEKDVACGISLMSANGLVLRVLGHGGEQLFNCFKSVQEKLWRYEPKHPVDKPIESEALHI